MRVFHIITGLDTGGTERMLAKLLRADAELRANTAVISLGGDGPVGAEIRALGLPVHCLHLSRLSLRLRPWRQLLQLRRTYSPDLIQGWLYHGNVAAWIAARCLRPHLPVLFNIRQSVQLRKERLDRVVWIMLQAILSRHCAAVIYNSTLARTQHEQLGFSASRGRLIPNGFDLEKFRPDASAPGRLRQRLGLDPEAQLIGMAARFDRRKGFDCFLQAAAQLRRQRGDVHFVLAGPGVDSTNRLLRRSINQLGLAAVVHCLGSVADMPGLFAGLDLAASCSTMEGFSNSIGEAMACGIPCAVTNVGASASIVGDTGAVVPAGNPEAATAAWARLLAADRGERRRNGEAARARIHERFAIAAIAASYRQLYTQIAAS